MAGYTIAIRIILFAILPSWGLGNAAATLVGQNLGAGDPDAPSARCGWRPLQHGLPRRAGAAVHPVRAPLIGVFTSDPAVAAVASRCLRIVSCGFVFYAFGMVIVQAFNGAGDTWTPTGSTWAVLGVRAAARLGAERHLLLGWGSARRLRRRRDRVLFARDRLGHPVQARHLEGEEV